MNGLNTGRLRDPARLLVFLTLIAVAAFVAGSARQTFVQAEPRSPQPEQPAAAEPGGQVSPSNVVRQGSPPAAADPTDLTKSDTAWEVEWELTHPNNKPFY